MITGLGVDIVEIDRMRAALERHPRMKERLFSAEERAYCDKRSRPEVHYALRFAAKEAVLKALGTGWSGGIRWTDVELVSSSGGKDGLAFGGEFSRQLREKGVSGASVSISTTRREACALVVLVG